MDSQVSLLIVIGVHLTGTVLGYPNGPPDAVCNNMMPGHGPQPQLSASPYTVQSSNTTAAPGDKVQVTVLSPTSTSFKGYIIRAAANSKLIGGTFYAPKTEGVLRCNNAALGHSSAAIKRDVTAWYQVPQDMTEGQQLIFVATVLQRYDRFWTNVMLQTPIRIVGKPDVVDTTNPSPSNPNPGSSNTGDSNAGMIVDDNDDKDVDDDDTDNGATQWQVGLTFLATLGLLTSWFIHHSL